MPRRADHWRRYRVRFWTLRRVLICRPISSAASPTPDGEIARGAEFAVMATTVLAFAPAAAERLEYRDLILNQCGIRHGNRCVTGNQ
jgi:hypothetical protein